MSMLLGLWYMLRRREHNKFRDHHCTTKEYFHRELVKYKLYVLDTNTLITNAFIYTSTLWTYKCWGHLEIITCIRTISNCYCSWNIPNELGQYNGLWCSGPLLRPIMSKLCNKRSVSYLLQKISITSAKYHCPERILNGQIYLYSMRFIQHIIGYHVYCNTPNTLQCWSRYV